MIKYQLAHLLEYFKFGSFKSGKYNFNLYVPQEYVSSINKFTYRLRRNPITNCLFKLLIQFALS